MLKHTKRTFVFILAILCVFVGIAGLILPVIPGLVFLALSLVIFSLFFPVIGHKMRHHSRHYPPLQEAIIKMEEWVRHKIGEI